MEKSEAFKNRSRIILWDLKLIFVISTQDQQFETVLTYVKIIKHDWTMDSEILYNQHTHTHTHTHHTHTHHTHTHTPHTHTPLRLIVSFGSGVSR